MKITDIQTTILRLPEVHPNGDGLQDTLIVEVHTDAGITGLGEAHTVPLVLKAVIDAPVSQLTGQGLRQMLIGEDPTRVTALWEKMYHHSCTYGRRGVVVHAISAIDMALWDILGKSCEQPVHALLGGATTERLRCYASDLTPKDVPAILDLAQRHRDAGFTAMKFGWGKLGNDVRSDVKWVAAVREALGDGPDIMIDMGTPVPLEDALWLGDALAEHGVAFLEEPLSPDDLDGFARLTDRSRTPIATGEKETTRHGFRDLMERGGLRIIQPDVARCGGITETMRIAALAEARGVEVIPHCWASDILVAATAHCLASFKRPHYLEFNATDNPLKTDLLVAPIRQVDGHVQVPTGPGLGIELDRDTVERFRWTPGGD
ncbi:mandelate racemase/muconate lactonizing enzyme family protein [Rhodobacteraceae bacterium CCMM004]|nr:mandelate racemase/muconate lactonizing enzyme family protein [Rhodobacteraceae bacterium CCMM004]